MCLSSFFVEDDFSALITDTAVDTTTVTLSSRCPKCVKLKKSGIPSCCAVGGAWFSNCGPFGDPSFDHTWFEGIQACKSKAAADIGLFSTPFANVYIFILTDTIIIKIIVFAVCPKCALHQKFGKASCCASGGAWFQNCGDPGDTNFEHTWGEGIQACKDAAQEAQTLSNQNRISQLRGVVQQQVDAADAANRPSAQALTFIRNIVFLISVLLTSP